MQETKEDRELIKKKIVSLHRHGKSPEKIAALVANEHYEHMKDGERYILPIVRAIINCADYQNSAN